MKKMAEIGLITKCGLLPGEIIRDTCKNDMYATVADNNNVMYRGEVKNLMELTKMIVPDGRSTTKPENRNPLSWWECQNYRTGKWQHLQKMSR